MKFNWINDWQSLGSELGWGVTMLSISYMHFPALKDVPLDGFSIIFFGLGFRISRHK